MNATARTTTTLATKDRVRVTRRYACPRCGSRFSFDNLDGPRLPPHENATGEKLCAGGGELPVPPWKETLSCRA